MTMDRAELEAAAAQAFPPGTTVPDAAASWAALTDMGWWMMTVPEAQGGLGLGAQAAAVIHQALGRALVPGSAIAQMLVIEALAGAAPSDARDEWLARAMAGEVMSTGLAAGLRAVPDADRAVAVLVVEPERIALVEADGMTAITPFPTWDETRQLFDVTLKDGPLALVLAQGDAAGAIAARLETSLHVALAADSLGAAEAILSLTIDYLKTRRQFDRPLAMFQALKHRAADHRTALGMAQALLWQVVADESVDPLRAGALKAHACAVAADICEDAIQLHGGIGLTMEHHCHLFLKRALLNAALGRSGDGLEQEAGRAQMAMLTSG